MLRLDGLLDIEKTADINEYTRLRFKNGKNYTAPEALTLFEQRYLDNETIKELCEKAYGLPLEEPNPSYVPVNIINTFAGCNVVPVLYSPMKKELVCVTLKELESDHPEIPYTKVIVKYTTPQFYFASYQKHYGVHKDLSDIPAKMLVDMIIKEAIEIGAADITLSTVGLSGRVYYNVRKRKVNSNRIFSADSMEDVIKYLTPKSPYDFQSKDPKYVDVNFNKDYRGRIVINRKHKGFCITCRLLPNESFNNTLEMLNLTPKTSEFLRREFMDAETGLRLIVGPTMSGKNTTALALLQEVASLDRYKIISVEIPVEQELPGVEQIHCETPEEYKLNIETLIHQNPDLAYITEIRDSTGLATMRMTNTGKRVISSLHSNGVAETISRIVDITGLSVDRIVQTLHSIVYQELVRDEEVDAIFPRCRYIRFTRELKYLLYGESLGNITKIIQEREDGDVWTLNAL